MQQLIYGPFRTPMCFKCDLVHFLTLTRFLDKLFCQTNPFTHQTHTTFSAQNMSGWPHMYMFIMPMSFRSTALTIQAKWTNMCEDNKSEVNYCGLCVLSIRLEIIYWEEGGCKLKVIRKLYPPHPNAKNSIITAKTHTHTLHQDQLQKILRRKLMSWSGCGAYHCSTSHASDYMHC